MIIDVKLIYGLAAMIFAALIAFSTAPIARVVAYKIGAIDVPSDDRRMHKTPTPRLGGLAIYFAFTVTTLVFCDYSPTLLMIWLGGIVLVAMGVIDDVVRLPAWVKLIVQAAVAVATVLSGFTIEFINLFGTYINLGVFEIPLTLLWILGLTNAINLIDGLDGLSCGVSTICSLSLLLVTLIMTDSMSAMLTAVIAGSCIGFLPFNTNPAKMFMGDTGALFLGYTFSIISIEGIFKFHTVVSFLIPLSIFGLPLFDTMFAFFRRLFSGKNPFAGDRGHIHHKLIDMGFNQKQSVNILYAICGILGISAIMFTGEKISKAAIIVAVGFLVYAIEYIIVKNPITRSQAGLVPRDDDNAVIICEKEKNENKNQDGKERKD